MAKPNPKKQITRLKKSTVVVGSVACLLIIAVVTFLLWPSLFNKSYYSTDKIQATTGLEELMNSINPSLRQTYENTNDLGCDSRNSVGLASYIHCDILAQKYFTINKDSAKDFVQSLNSQLNELGFHSTIYNNDYHMERTVAVPKGTQEGSAPYRNNDAHQQLVLYVEFLSSNTKRAKAYAIQQLIDTKKIPQPSPNESIVGIRVQKTYWTCRADTLFSYCPAPPSKPL